MKYLCVGGSQDGLFLELAPDRTCVTVLRPHGNPAARFIGPSDPMPFPRLELAESEDYRPHKWHVEGRTFVLLAPDGWTGEQVFEALIAAYGRRGGETP